MSTATITLTATETEAANSAIVALTRVLARDFPWAYARSGEIKMYAAGLRESLYDHAALTAERTHPATVFPDLDGTQDNAMETALDRLTQDIRDWTTALTDLANEAEDAEDAACALGEVA